jgi:hypothetical protein
LSYKRKAQYPLRGRLFKKLSRRHTRTSSRAPSAIRRAEWPRAYTSCTPET